MTGALILLAVLIGVAIKIRPRKHAVWRRSTRTFLWRDRRDPPRDDSE